MDPESAISKKQSDAEINLYITQWLQRYPQFLRDHEAELRESGHDFFGRFLHEQLLFRGKSAYDSLLQMMLTPTERDRLHIDPKITQAWQIFVDLCWIKKRMKLAGLMAGVIFFCFGALLFIAWLWTHLISSRGH